MDETVVLVDDDARLRKLLREYLESYAKVGQASCATEVPSGYLKDSAPSES